MNSDAISTLILFGVDPFVWIDPPRLEFSLESYESC